MKRKIGLLVLSLTLTAALTSCGNGTSEVKPSAVPTPTVQPTITPKSRIGVDYNDWAGDDAINHTDGISRDTVNGAADRISGYLGSIGESIEDMVRDAGHDIRQIGR